MIPTYDISAEALDTAGGFAFFHHCRCSFRPSLMAYPALLPRREHVKRNKTHRAMMSAARLSTLKTMMTARATLETWMGSEGARTNVWVVLVGVDIAFLVFQTPVLWTVGVRDWRCCSSLVSMI